MGGLGNYAPITKTIFCTYNLKILTYKKSFWGSYDDLFFQRAVAWDMLKIYNDFIDSQERRR